MYTLLPSSTGKQILLYLVSISFSFPDNSSGKDADDQINRQAAGG